MPETTVPYSREHKERTRERIVEAARKLFNRHGFEQVSIDQIMAGAGLTRGGFYYHFSSKDELYAEAVTSFATSNPFRRSLQGGPVLSPPELARALLDLYLGDAVFSDIDNHCPLYALPGDVARSGESPQRAYTNLARGLIGVFEKALEGAPDAQGRAQAIVALCVGGMLLARTTDDPQLRQMLRASAREQGLVLLKNHVIPA
jgi:TetR/AcrR family transcriptional repressor of nem operon